MHYSTANSPCPVCGRTKDGDCRWPGAPDFVLCHTHGPGDMVSGWRCVGSCENPIWTMWRLGEETRRRERWRDEPRWVREERTIAAPRHRFNTSIATGQLASVGDVQRFAEALGVPASAVVSLAPSYYPWGTFDDDSPPQLVFPSRDGKGEIIGAQRRYLCDPPATHRHHGKNKVNVHGGFSGMFFNPANWHSPAGRGPIFLPEGASDTIALVGMGLNAVGRPSTLGGVHLLVDLLRECQHGTEVVVLGENDEHINAKGEKIWPGKDGAMRTAQSLANLLPNLVVRWSMVPAGAKDTREWFSSRWNAGVPVDHLREEFLRKTMDASTVCFNLLRARREAESAAVAEINPEAGKPTQKLGLCDLLSLGDNVRDSISHDGDGDGDGLQPQALPAETKAVKDCLPEWAKHAPGKDQCPRKTTVALENRHDPLRCRVAGLACSCWNCEACRVIKARDTVVHLAGKIQADLDAGRSIRAIILPEGERHATQEALRRVAVKYDCTWQYADLLCADGERHLFFFSLPEHVDKLPARFEDCDPLTVQGIADILADWSLYVRNDGYPPPDEEEGRIRAVNFSRAWQPTPPKPSDWQVIGGSAETDPAVIREVIEAEKVEIEEPIPVRDEEPNKDTPPRPRKRKARSTASPYIWKVDFRVRDEWHKATVLAALLDAGEEYTTPFDHECDTGGGDNGALGRRRPRCRRPAASQFLG